MLPEAKSFYITDKEYPQYIGTAEVTLMYPALFEMPKEIDTSRTWYYFSRIFVHRKIRNKGHATRLMQQLIEWADTYDYHIFCDINPYGDLTLEQLIVFYKKFGFKQIRKSTMIR